MRRRGGERKGMREESGLCSELVYKVISMATIYTV